MRSPEQTTRIPLDRVRVNGGTQTRAGLTESVVADYAEAMESGRPHTDAR